MEFFICSSEFGLLSLPPGKIISVSLPSSGNKEATEGQRAIEDPVKTPARTKPTLMQRIINADANKTNKFRKFQPMYAIISPKERLEQPRLRLPSRPQTLLKDENATLPGIRLIGAKTNAPAIRTGARRQVPPRDKGYSTNPQDRYPCARPFQRKIHFRHKGPHI